MDDIEFFDKRSRHPLRYERDEGYYVTELYQDWFVQIASREKPIRPAIEVVDKFEYLEWNDSLEGFVPTKKEDSEREYFKGRAGLLILYDTSSPIGPRRLHPSLYIAPTMPEEDYVAILELLRALAFAQKSGLLAPIPIRKEEGSKDPFHLPPRYSQWAGRNFLDLVNSVRENWPRIRKNPAKEIRLVPQIIDLANPRNHVSARAIHHAVRKPGQRKDQVLSRQEDFDTLENQFTASLLGDIVRTARPLAANISRSVDSLMSTWGKPDEKKKQYYNLWRNKQTDNERQANRLKEIARQIQDSAKIAESYLEEPFLKSTRRNTTILTRPYPKIAESKEYGALYKAYQGYRVTLGNGTGPRRTNFFQALEERTVKRTSDLFEMWAFLQTYATFVGSFGFEAQGDSPLELADVENGEITLNGSSYKLSFTPKNMKMDRPLCEIDLAYGPKIKAPLCKRGKRCYDEKICPSLLCFKKIQQSRDWSELTPDVRITIRTHTVTKKIALDFKYRDYVEQRNDFANQRGEFKVDSVFDLDLLDTAKMKYLDGLEMDASFIMHSDKRPQFTKFGEKPFETTPDRERAVGETFFPAHRVGAVYVGPDNLDNLEKLLKCFLMYHLGIVNICWSCGIQLTEENQGKNKNKHPDWKGDYYQCTECCKFWIRQNCGKNKDHPLIKLGRDSFHQVAGSNEWQCICPKCGDSPNYA